MTGLYTMGANESRNLKRPEVTKQLTANDRILIDLNDMTGWLEVVQDGYSHCHHS